MSAEIPESLTLKELAKDTGFISNSLPIEAVPAPDTVIINGIEYCRWTHGDAHL